MNSMNTECLTYFTDTAKLLRTFGLSLILTVISTANAVHADPVRFEFIYLDPPGFGFNDPQFGQQSQAALEFAGTIWGGVLDANFPGETVTVTAQFGLLPDFIAISGPTILGFDFPGSVPDTSYTPAQINHLLGRDNVPPGHPRSPQGAEIFLVFDFLRIPFIQPIPGDYYFGTDGNTPPDRIDLVTIALHEIAHGLGFISTLTEAGSYGGDLPVIYDRFVVDAAGIPLTTLPPAERLAAATSGDGLFWSGINAVLANGGVQPNLAADPPFSPGMNVSHFSDAVGGLGGSLMSPSLFRGEAIHAPNAIELGLLHDIGWVNHVRFSFETGLALIPSVVVPGVGVFNATLELLDPDGLRFFLRDATPIAAPTEPLVTFSLATGLVHFPVVEVPLGDTIARFQVEMRFVPETLPMEFMVTNATPLP